ncbi:MAG: glycosyltransferase [Thermodesulfobacteriota bacterium]|nr:glycosyltransferase [Thermodesulfobacteriota bacterium]
MKKQSELRNKPKIALIQCVIPHYRVPFFRRLALEVDLALFYGKGEKNGSWQNAKHIDGFTHKRLFSFTVKFHSGDFPIRLVWFPTLFLNLYKSDPEVIISEGFTNIVNNIFTWFYCKLLSIPWIIWDGGRRKEKPMSFFRKLAEPMNIFLLRQANAIIAYGSIARDYFVSSGIDPAKIFTAQNTIDVEGYFKEAERLEAKPTIIEEVRTRLGLHEKKIILYVGALEKRRRLQNLITVFDDLKKEVSNIALVIIGDGPYEVNLKEIVEGKQVKDVFFLGRIEDAKGKYFLISYVIVQPGCNSLATIEAMAYGSPVITVPYGGPEYEMVQNGKTGFIVKRDNLLELKVSIKKLITDDELRKRMGKSAQERIMTFNLDNMAKGFLEAIRYEKK